MTTETEQPVAKPEQLLELKIEKAAYAPIRWCFHKPLFEAVKDMANPHVLFAVRAIGTRKYGDLEVETYTDTSRYITPLKAEMQFVAFKRPGRNQVCAVVFDMADKATAKAAGRITAKGSMGSSIFEDEPVPKWFNNDWGGIYALQQTVTSEDLDIPAEMFAPEPPAWKKRLMDAYFNSKTRDECNTFWRTVGAVAATPFAVPLGYVYKAVLTLLMYFFGRWPNKNFWQTAVSPLAFRKSIHRAVKGCPKPFWWAAKEGKPDELRIWPLAIINPPILTLLPTAVFLFFQIPHRKTASHPWHPIVSWSWWKTVEWIDGCIIGVIAAVLAVWLLAFGSMMLIAFIVKVWPGAASVVVPFEKLGTYLDRRGVERAVAKAKAEKDRKEQLEAELVAMTCRSEASEVSVAALPKHKRTIKLKIYDHKAKHCRPYAG